VKAITLVLFAASLALHAEAVDSQPILVAVEMNNLIQIKIWQALGYNTYDFIQNTAIAEIDETHIQVIRARGFSVQVIDRSPWTENYFICSVPESDMELPGRVIWQKEATYIVKSATRQAFDFMHSRLPYRPVRRQLLSERFWDQITTKTVTLSHVAWDPFIQSIVDQVSTDSLTSYIQRMQDFQTRLIFSDSTFVASEWIRQKFNTFGYAGEFDSFYISFTNFGYWPDTGYERNVLAQTQGTINPSRIFIISGHQDAIIWPDTQSSWTFAPGADDNASGVATVLEAARIFNDYSWEKTIHFMTWSAEEVGLLGSDDYASRAESLGLDIGGVINLDMTGWVNAGALNCNIHHTYDFCLWLSSLFNRVGQIYAPELTYFEAPLAGGSDDLSFSSRGYSAIWGAERWYYQNPNWHRPSDTLSNMTPELYTGIAKVAIATLAILGLHPDPVSDVMVADIGNGSSLQVGWSPSVETDVVGYRVYWGLQSEVYTDSQYVAGIAATADTITGLVSDSIYYITVRAIDSDNRLSYAATEATGTPSLIPAVPSGVVAVPIPSGIDIYWLRNTELDIAGYRLYRRVNDNPDYDSLNISLLTDTSFSDSPLSGANRYYYAVRAFDLAGNYSDLSPEAYGRPITLDQGILIVDETRNTPFPPNPTPPDSLQDEYYRYVLQGYTYTEYDFGSTADRPVLADFVPYSTVLWHADDYSERLAAGSVNDMRDYLDAGGNLWFVGWKPIGNLRNSSIYPLDFGPGDFVYDYLKVSHAELSAVSDSFQAAVGLLGYPHLDVDTSKVPVPNWGNTLRYIDAYTLVPPAEEIYEMDMRNNNSPFEGETCGLRYLGNDFKTILFGFPLYFMDETQARTAAQKVMDDFGEIGVDELTKDITPTFTVSLQQNSPNPFAEQTRISYQLGHAGQVCLRVYNAAGQLIKTLVDSNQEPGSYSVIWTGRDDRGRRVSNGIYFYHMKFEDANIFKKMITLR
jgi:hypothetical protein